MSPAAHVGQVLACIAILVVAVTGVLVLGVLAGQAIRWAWRELRGRLVPLTPPGRLHERHVRRELGMARKHPEHLTRPPSRADRQLLDALQEQAWPENEWVFHIADYWREGR